MYNVFKAPIICELKPSLTLATGFLVLFILPILATVVFYQRFPLSVITTITLLFSYCVYLIAKYAIRSGANCVKLLRLHKDTALITYNNSHKKSAKVTFISAASHWIIIEFDNGQEKVILDKSSVGKRTYCQMCRQIRSYDVNESKLTLTN